MYKILMALRRWAKRLNGRDCAADDPLAHLSLRELADLPPLHPERDSSPC